MSRRIKQRMISATDLDALNGAPEESKPLAVWLWLNLDPLGRGPMDPEWISTQLSHRPSVDTVLDHLLMLMEVGFLTTYLAEGREWILLLNPLRVDLRGTTILTPDPPHGDSVAVGRESAREGERARASEWARAEARAEDAARADAWDAVQRDREREPERPPRPLILDAPQMFCDEHMPGGPRDEKCGPCRDARLVREEWLTRRVYEERLTKFRVHVETVRVVDVQPDADEEPW